MEPIRGTARLSLLCILGLFGSSLVSGASSGGQAGVPDELYSGTGERVWISSSHARSLLRLSSSETQSAAPELSWILEAFERDRRMSVAENALSCLEVYEPTVTLPAQAILRPTLLDIIKSARLAASGVVLARRTGFVRGSPQVLLLVGVQEWFMRGVEIPQPEEVLVSYVPTRMRVAGTRVCRRSRGLPAPPRVGTRVHFIAARFDDEVEGARPLIDPGYAIFFERNGRVHTSDHIAQNTPNWRQFERLDFVEALTARIFRGRPEHDRAPLVLDLDGNGVHTSSLRNESIVFDIDQDGYAERTAWLLGFSEDVFLWIDIDGNRRVDGVQELVGMADRTPWGGVLEASGAFEALAAYDLPKYGGNGNGRIDRGDRVWAHLGTWHDSNMDGVSQPRELSGVATQRIASFDLAYVEPNQLDGSLNYQVAVGRFWMRGAGGGLHARPLVAVAFRHED